MDDLWDVVCVFLISIFLFSACGESPVIEITHKFPANQWVEGDSIEFALKIEQPDSLYELVLSVKYGKDFQWENVYTTIYTVFPNGERTKDLISLELINKYGFSEGDCGYDNCKVDINLLSPVTFEEAGTYRLVLYQSTRNEVIKHLNSLTLQLLPYHQPDKIN